VLGADYYDERRGTPAVAMGIGANALIERAIIDKNARIGEGARLVNSRDVDEFDGDGFYIRNGIIIVPKGGVIPAGFTV
jgi:glucose-1-phosphate adenylyltransferase